jgi:molybdenum cofactor cytidylyltransferase
MRGRLPCLVLAPVVLAAGASTRMGSPKALLLDREGRPFVARIVRTLLDAGLTGVAVVTSPSTHDAIGEALRGSVAQSVRLLVNPDPDRGQLSSIWTAMDHMVTEDTEALVMTLVDVPFVAVETVRTVVNAYRATRAPIVRPARGEEHGHPVVIDRALFGDLRAADLSTGAKPVVRARAAQIVNVPTDDDGAFRDIDTPGEYARLLAQ